MGCLETIVVLRRGPAGRLRSLGSTRLEDQKLDVDQPALLARRAPRHVDAGELRASRCLALEDQPALTRLAYEDSPLFRVASGAVNERWSSPCQENRRIMAVGGGFQVSRRVPTAVGSRRKTQNPVPTAVGGGFQVSRRVPTAVGSRRKT